MNALKLDSFKEINEKKFLDKNGIALKYTELETGTEKLRIKHKVMKQDFSRITDRIKNGSRLSPNKEPRWFKHLNLVLCEANETISLLLSAGDTSFVNERNESHDENEGSSCSESENLAKYTEDENQTSFYKLHSTTVFQLLASFLFLFFSCVYFSSKSLNNRRCFKFLKTVYILSF